MCKLKVISVFVLLVLLSIADLGAVTMAQANNTVENQVVFKIPIGSGSNDIGYAGLSIEMLPWGPTSLAVGEDHTFYIADVANNRIQHYNSEGSFLSSIDFSDEIIGVVDIEVKNNNLIVLDIAAMTPAVRQLAMDGTIIRSYPISKQSETLWEGINSLHIGCDGEVYVVAENTHLFQLTDHLSAPLTNLHSTVGFRDAKGRVYSIQNANWSTDPHTGEILIYDQSGDTQRITIQVSHTLAGLRYLQTGQDGSFFVVVEEIFYDGTIHVDQTVHHYGNNGNLLGMARVPLGDFYVPVENGIVVSPDGNVYALVPKQDQVEIQQLTFRPKLAPIFPSEEPVAANKSVPTSVKATVSVLSCRSRTTMMNVAYGYYSNQAWLSSTNTDGSCTSRTKPRYIGGAGYYTSVAYDAEGWDTVSGYNDKMYPGTYQAGDISFAGTASCSRGVDCSGFVTRVWGLTAKLYTWTIPNYSQSLGSTGDLLQGDVLNKPYDHVAVFYSTCSGGATVYHSTTYGSYDRVIKRCHSWSYFNGYSPRRYNNVCH